MQLASPGLFPWSVHMYFHAPVRSGELVRYRAKVVKAGRSTATVRVKVLQDDRLRATALAQFGATAAGPEHQYRPPQVPAPEHVAPEERLIHPSILPPETDFEKLGYPAKSLVELRIVADEGGSDGGAETSYARKAWMRVVPEIPGDPLTTASAQCYLSDITLGTTALAPHGGREASADLQLGAVELALWFTGPALMSEWTLFVQDTVFSGRGHALAHGAFYSSEGDVTAVALQNALMRAR